MLLQHENVIEQQKYEIMCENEIEQHKHGVKRENKISYNKKIKNLCGIDIIQNNMNRRSE